MNTLTKNRILEKGDEYLLDGKWQPIPSKLIGLQVMFSKLTQVRRPSEETLPETPDTRPNSSPTEVRECAVSPAPISPDASNTKAAQGTAVPKATAPAEAKQVPDSGVSPAVGESPVIVEARVQLPTVISKKAHEIPVPPGVIEGAIASHKRMLKTHPPIDLTGSPVKTPTGDLTIPFPDKSWPCQWIGRNGTFTARGTRFTLFENLDEKDNIIQIRPVGKRGVAKNALIQFPASIIPQVVDWLLRMQPAPTTPKE